MALVLALVTLDETRPTGATNLAFAPEVGYSTGSTPYGVALGDLNADGKLDLVASSVDGNTVSVRLGNGDGTFGALSNPLIGYGSYGVAIADVNADAKQDIVVAATSNNTVGILLGNGDGTFAAVVLYPVGAFPTSVAVADFNGDARSDIAVSNDQGPNTVSILLGNGNGTFATAVGYGSSSAFSVAAADFNGDAAVDLVLGHSFSSFVSIMLGNGNGTFAAPATYAASTNARFVSTGDVNGDGALDLATANFGNGTMSILRGSGLGTFGSPDHYDAGIGDGSPHWLSLRDVNGDGRLDLSVLRSTGKLYVLIGDAFGIFSSSPTIFPAASHARLGAFGDLNADGKPDLVVTSASSYVGALLNTSAAWVSAFTDDPLAAATQAKAVHVTELRSAINTLRTRNGLPVFAFTDPSLTSGSYVRAVHVTELRAALDAVYDAIGLARKPFIDGALTAGFIIRRAHIEQLRDAVRAADWFILSVSKAGNGSGTVTSSPSGINCGSTCTRAFPPGTVVTLTASAASSTFTGWSGACTGTGTCQVTLSEDRSVTATFTSHTLTVSKSGAGSGTITSSPAGINCGSDCSEGYAVNTNVALTPTPASNSYFVNWTGACSGSGACSVAMTADRSVGAVFAVKLPHTLTVTKTGSAPGTVTSSPAGIDCGADCSEVYYTTDVVTLTASAPSGSYFANWTGACTGGGTCTLTMTSDVTVGATFNTFTIDIDPVRGTVRMPNKYRTGNWSVGGSSNVNYVLQPPGWTVGGAFSTNYVAIPPGWSLAGAFSPNYIAVPPGWSVAGGGGGTNYVAVPPGFSVTTGFSYNTIVLPPGWTAGGGVSGANFVAVPPGYSASNNSAFGTNFVTVPSSPGWTVFGGGGYNNVAIASGWSAGRGSNGPNNVVIPPGWSTFGGISYPNVVSVPPGWATAGSLNTANLIAYPTTAVETLEIAFNDPGWIAWFQALKTNKVMSDSDIADVVIYVLGGGGNSRMSWNNNQVLRPWGWQGAAPAGQWP
jgi:hypothetical protein